jgi:hypothetical protein
LAVKQMMQQGSGIIANVTQNAYWLNVEEMVDHMPLPGEGMPGMSIAVMRGITDRIPPALKREVAPYGITVLTLDPGMTLSVDKGLWEELATVGYRPDLAHSSLVPARAMSYIATHANPTMFSGKMVIAADLVREKKLLSESEIGIGGHGGAQEVISAPQVTALLA